MLGLVSLAAALSDYQIAATETVINSESSLYSPNVTDLYPKIKAGATTEGKLTYASLNFYAGAGYVDNENEIHETIRLN